MIYPLVTVIETYATGKNYIQYVTANIISRLRRNEYVSLETIENICRVFQCRAELYTCRRYPGNKFKLIKFFRDVVDKNCSAIETVENIFFRNRCGRVADLRHEQNRANTCGYYDAWRHGAITLEPI